MSQTPTLSVVMTHPYLSFSPLVYLTFEWAGAHDEVHVKAEVMMSEFGLKILELCKEPMSSPEIIKELGHKKRSGAFTRTLKLLLVEDLIMFTIPDKPRSKKQKYVTTEKGRKILEEL